MLLPTCILGFFFLGTFTLSDFARKCVLKIGLHLESILLIWNITINTDMKFGQLRLRPIL